MKKVLIALLCILLALCFISCQGNNPAVESTESGTESSKPTDTTSSDTAAATDAETSALTTAEESTETKQLIKEGSRLNYTDVKAMWISQFDLNAVYCSNGSQVSEATFKTKIKKILNNVKNNGFNTVIVQMRPNADSMYPSEYYPMSYYVVGKYGNEASYDPVAIIIEQAHELGLSFHAWINPMRCMTTSQISSVNSRYLIRQWYDSSEYKGTRLVANGNNYYLNPAYPEVRELIINGAAEILEKYPVDGLHMDDYFYPTTDASFDSKAYSAYKTEGGTKSLPDFRREQLSLLVSGLYSAVKAKDKDILFGISPAGNINTVYNSQYADVYSWCSKDGYLDYICPQVYFGLEHQTYDFKTVCSTWQNIIKKDGIDLIIGMTLGKAKSKVDNYAGSGKNEWAEHTDILKRCLEHTLKLKKCTGVSYFCYQYFYDPTSGTEVTETRNERKNFIPVLKEISWAD